MARRIENPDGMYSKECIPLNELTANDRARVQMAINRQFNRADREAWLLDCVRTIQKQSDDSDIRSSARHIELMIEKELPAALARGEIDLAIVVAMNIGAFSEQLAAKMKYDSTVSTGKKNLRGSLKGTEILTAATLARYNEINLWIAEKMKIRSKVSLTQRRHQAAEHFGVHVTTVLAAQKTIRKK